MQNAIFPMYNIKITQRENSSYSHKGLNALDLAGKDTGIENVFAPCDAKIVAIYNYLSMANAVVFQSVTKIKCANDRTDYITFMLMHDNNISNLKVGKTFKQYDVIYQEGTFGYATGNHVHLEVKFGKFDGINKNGWSLKNHVNTQNVFFLTNKHKVYDLCGNRYKTLTQVKPPILPNNVKKFSKKRTYKASVDITKRLSPKRDGKNIYGLLKKDKIISCVGYIDNDKHRWLVYLNVKNQWTYIAECELVNLKNKNKYFLKDITK